MHPIIQPASYMMDNHLAHHQSVAHPPVFHLRISHIIPAWIIFAYAAEQQSDSGWKKDVEGDPCLELWLLCDCLDNNSKQGNSIVLTTHLSLLLFNFCPLHLQDR